VVEEQIKIKQDLEFELRSLLKAHALLQE